MDCAQDQEEQVSSLMEVIGDSEANLEVKAYDDDYDDDGRESCNGHVKCMRDDEEDEEEEGDDDDDDEKVMAWSTWIAMARSEWGKRREEEEEEEERSPLVADEEENKLFWETCLASGYP